LDHFPRVQGENKKWLKPPPVMTRENKKSSQLPLELFGLAGLPDWSLLEDVHQKTSCFGKSPRFFVETGFPIHGGPPGCFVLGGYTTPVIYK